jgi:hypothetical protein
VLNYFDKDKMKKTSDFQDKITEERHYFYRLQNKGIFKLNRQKIGKGYRYSWELTHKGKQIFDSNPNLKKILKNKNIKELYKKIKELTK